MNFFALFSYTSICVLFVNVAAFIPPPIETPRISRLLRLEVFKGGSSYLESLENQTMKSMAGDTSRVSASPTITKSGTPTEEMALEEKKTPMKEVNFTRTSDLLSKESLALVKAQTKEAGKGIDRTSTS